MAQYSTTFDNLDGGNSLSDQDGWLTNDEYTGATYNTSTNASQAREIGQAETVTVVDGFSSSATDQLAVIGGLVNAPGGALPGHSTVYVYHPVNLGPSPANIVFSTDFLITPLGTLRPTHDSFGFTFQSANGATNLFSIDFVPATVNPDTNDAIGYSVNGVQVTTSFANTFSINARYHLVVSANLTAGGGNFSAYIVPENGTGGENGARVTVASNVAFTGTIAELAATWSLANKTSTAPATGTNPADVPATGNTNTTAYTGGGQNSLFIDNLSIVPEPSTYALLGVGAVGLAAAMRRRRLA